MWGSCFSLPSLAPSFLPPPPLLLFSPLSSLCSSLFSYISSLSSSLFFLSSLFCPLLCFVCRLSPLCHGLLVSLFPLSSLISRLSFVRLSCLFYLSFASVHLLPLSICSSLLFHLSALSSSLISLCLALLSSLFSSSFLSYVSSVVCHLSVTVSLSLSFLFRRDLLGARKCVTVVICGLPEQCLCGASGGSQVCNCRLLRPPRAVL